MSQRKEALGAVALGQGTEILGVEVVVEVGTDLSVTDIAEGKGIIVVEAGAAVQVLFIAETAREGDMMMRIVVGAGHMEVPPLLGVVPVLGGAHLQSRHAPGLKVPMDANLLIALLLLKVCHLVVDLLILEVRRHDVLMLKNEPWLFHVWRKYLESCVV